MKAVLLLTTCIVFTGLANCEESALNPLLAATNTQLEQDIDELISAMLEKEAETKSDRNRKCWLTYGFCWKISGKVGKSDGSDCVKPPRCMELIEPGETDQQTENKMRFLKEKILAGFANMLRVGLTAEQEKEVQSIVDNFKKTV